MGARGRLFARGIALVGTTMVLVPGAAHAAITVSGPASPVAEGDPGGGGELVFTLDRTGGILQGDAEVRVRTTGGTAVGGLDFTPVSTVVTVPGSLLGTSVPVVVPIVGDASDEPDETVIITIDEAQGDSIAGGSATDTGSIADDDGPPALTLQDGTGVEGTGAPGRIELPVAVSVPSGKPITVPYTVTAGTAGGDDIDLSAGSVDIAPGAASGVIPVPTVGDALDEADETFTVALGTPVDATLATGTATGTVLNDDTPVGAIGSLALPEGTGPSPTLFAFPLTLSNPSERAISFRVRTFDGQATAGSDYVPLDGVVTFAPGETAKAVTVAVAADAVAEPDEAFGVALSEPVSAVVGPSGTGIGVLVNDDLGAPPPPAVSGAVPIPIDASLPVVDPSADRSDPRLRITSLRFRRPRTLRATVSCPASEISCRGTVTVFNVPNKKAKNKRLRRETRFGRATYTVAGGKRRTLNLRMTTAGRRMLRSAGRVRIRAFGVARDPAGNVGTARRTTTIRR